MALIELPEGKIETIIPIMNGALYARLWYGNYTDMRDERRLIINFNVEVGIMQNELNELDEIIGTTFTPKKHTLIKDGMLESFIADDNTWVNPTSGSIVKYANQHPTEEMELQPYAKQYNWFAHISANQPMLVDDFIEQLLHQKIANNELEIQKF